MAKETYNSNELKHIAVNYAINCLHGYEGSFDDWFNILSPSWREIANTPCEQVSTETTNPPCKSQVEKVQGIREKYYKCTTDAYGEGYKNKIYKKSDLDDRFVDIHRTKGWKFMFEMPTEEEILNCIETGENEKVVVNSLKAFRIHRTSIRPW